MGKPKGLQKKTPLQNEINVTPLIDVVLVLLIIFMVLTPITISEMSVNLPDKTETVEQDDVPKDQLLLAVCEDGTFTLNRQALEAGPLREDLKRRLRAKAKKVVFVDAHPKAGYERVVTALDLARDAGADRLGMASLKTPADFTACTAPVEEGAEAEPGSEPTSG
jgi:biopolymer transport protein ExbD/biopolymer transport protein TolR